MSDLPLVIDLDGTLLLTDSLQESMFAFAAQSLPGAIATFPALRNGRASFKRALADQVTLDVSLLPYNQPLLEWLRSQRKAGRSLILCTGADQTLAESVAAHLKLFDRVMGSDGSVNLIGKNKARCLVDCFGERGFDYVGNSVSDLKVWEFARSAVVVNAGDSLLNRVKQLCPVSEYFPTTKPDAAIWSRAIRVHQWLKNLLLFAPLVSAHLIFDGAAWIAATLGFIAFCLCASSIYIVNDLLDLANDRSHPRKRNRPFAAGHLSHLQGVCLVPLMLISSFWIGSYIGLDFLKWLSIYLVLTVSYSFLLKSIAVVDVVVLAMLYTLRIIAGASAIELQLSAWILAFSVFVFVSLAFVKRYAELNVNILKGEDKVKGRAYYVSDAPVIQAIGTSSAFCSILVFVLYLNSPDVAALYASPDIIWLCTPVLIYWHSWMWMSAHRGNMHDDPIVFAVSNRHSLISGCIFLGILLTGAIRV